MVTLQLRQLSVPLGHRVILHDVSWQEFEAILEELGDHRATRLAYSQGTLEMRMPLPKHDKAKVIIGDLVKIIVATGGSKCSDKASSRLVNASV